MKKKLPKRGDVLKFDGVDRLVLTTVKRLGPGEFHEIVFDYNVVCIVMGEDGKPITIIRSNESP